jgi:hypothetical protein
MPVKVYLPIAMLVEKRSFGNCPFLDAKFDLATGDSDFSLPHPLFPVRDNHDLVRVGCELPDYLDSSRCRQLQRNDFALCHGPINIIGRGKCQSQLPQFQGCAGRKAAEMLEFASALRICGAKFWDFQAKYDDFS